MNAGLLVRRSAGTAVVSLSLVACMPPPATPAGANAEGGRLLLRQFGCGECHDIPGVVAARGVVGPPLAGVGARAYLAGRLPNTPANMVRWIRAPRSIDPGTRMPDLQVTESHAQDMAAYLQTLR